MRLALVAAVAACQPAAPAAITLATSESAPRGVSSAPAEPSLAQAVQVRAAGDGAWARALPRDPRFATYNVPNHGTVLLTWRVAPPRAAPVKCEDDDALAEDRTFALVVASGEKKVSIPLGAIRGVPIARGLTYCRSRGAPAVTDGDIAAAPGVASTFTADANAYRDELVVIRDGALLHLLSRHGNREARCEAVKQGPLDACRGHEWVRLAEIEVGVAHLFEAVDHRGHAMDCGMPGCYFP